MYGLLVAIIPLIIAKYRLNPNDDNAVILFGRIFVASRLVSGLLWAYGVIAITSIGDPTLLWLFVAVVASLGGNAATTQGDLPWAVISFVAPPYFMLIGYFLGIGGHFEPPALLGLALIGFAMAKTTRSSYRQTSDAIKAQLAERQLTATLAQQASELNKLMKMKDLFLATVSHDLRQPAQTILLLVESLSNQSEPLPNTARLGPLGQASDQINRVITRLLDVARLDLEKGEPNANWFDLNALLENIRSMMAIHAERHGIDARIEIAERIAVYADEHYVERIIQNLLANAIEHSGGSRVTIGTEVDDDRDLHIVITDDGKGVSAEILQSFSTSAPGYPYQASPPGTRGLGLSIAQRLASAGGYPLHAKLTPAGGSRFDLVLSEFRSPRPAEAASAVESKASNSQPADRSDGTDPQRKEAILIIEDDALVRLGLFAMFEQSNYEAHVSEDLESAKAVIQSLGRDPAVILIDWHLRDGENAETVLPELFDQLTRNVPVLVLSGHTALADRVDAVSTKLGGTRVGFLQKPATSVALLNAIEALQQSVPVHQQPSKTSH